MKSFIYFFICLSTLIICNKSNNSKELNKSIHFLKLSYNLTKTEKPSDEFLLYSLFCLDRMSKEIEESKEWYER
jgi:hypothetical protein